jgi:hypothetical protein
MREGTVGSVSENEYSQLIGELVQQALSEVEDIRDWVQLRTTIQIVTEVDNFSYVLTDAGTSFNILGVHEDTEDFDLHKAPSYNWMNHRLLDNNRESNQPQYYDVNGQSANGDPIVNFFPVPDDVYNVNFNMKIKSVLSDDLDTTPMPWLPVVLRAQMLAVDERGDDQGTSVEVLGDAYSEAVASAVTYDATNYPDEMIWEVV